MRKQLVSEAALWEDTNHPQSITFWSTRMDLKTS